MKKKGHLITCVHPGSMAEELEIEVGDKLLEINGHVMEDIFDYQYYMEETEVEILIQKPDGEEWLLEIEKDEDEDLGVSFENGLMDEYRSCRNKCMFCFIDQMPPGMRDTLYFKDDDSRLSFLQGNYITLTNMSDNDIERIIRYHLAPINISVHTVDPELRCKMLHNRFAGDALKKIDRLYEAGIEMNGQIVLCKGLNDREQLEKSIEKLGSYLPHMRSVSVVPVGLTKFRDSLYPLESLTKEDMEDTIDRIERWQKVFMEQYGYHFIQASDEFYLMTGRELPEESRYDGYIQLENGVGMLRLLLEEVKECLNGVHETLEREITIATGVLVADFIKSLADMVMEAYQGLTVHVVPVINHYFGEKITVSGLITGQDLIEQMKTAHKGSTLLIPINMMKSGEEIFLDDITLQEAAEAIGTQIITVKSSGRDFVNALIGKGPDDMPDRFRPYELKEIVNE